MTPDIEQDNIYATLPMRIKAMAIDSLIYALMFISLPMLVTSLYPHSNDLRIISMILPILILEPFLITFAGCTIGQYLMGIRVVIKDLGEKCPLPLSFPRYFVKFLLGGYSLIYMLFSNKRQAVHDYVAKTIVVLSKRKQAAHPEFAEEQEEEAQIERQYKYPSGIRRFVFFVIWYVVAFLVIGVLLDILFSFFILIDLIPYEDLESDVFSVIIVIFFWALEIFLFFAIAYWAAKGYLPGAMRKLVPQEEVEADEKQKETEVDKTEKEHGEAKELTEKQIQIEKENRTIVKGYTSLFTLFGLILGMILSIILLDDIIEIFLIILLVSFAGSVSGYFIAVFKKKSFTEESANAETTKPNQNDQKDIE